MGRAGSIDPATRRSLNPAAIRRPRPRRGVELTLEHGSITMVAPHCASSLSGAAPASVRIGMRTAREAPLLVPVLEAVTLRATGAADVRAVCRA